jgi:hypothetical protein
VIKLDIDKNIDCPNSCALRVTESPVVFIPPPKNVVGIIISQDPTLKWGWFYNLSMSHDLSEETLRRTLFASAIPYNIFYKIREYMGNRMSENDYKSLYDVLFDVVYWTHFHKCFTDDKDMKFDPKNGAYCADKWLINEIFTFIKESNVKFIISLGNPVKDWLLEKFDISKLHKANIELILLPHTSGRVHKWNNKDDDSIISEIKKLVGICLRLTNNMA